jgi:hypothetical protein
MIVHGLLAGLEKGAETVIAQARPPSGVFIA